MKKLLILTLLLSFRSHAKDDPKYPVATIPAELKVGADVVVREDHMRFTILAKDRATHYVHLVATIFNEKGKDYASHVVGYDKLTRILDLKGTSYDAQGNVIKKIKSKDVYDQASFDGFTLFSDDRLKSFDLSNPSYPYTVEVEYELEYKFLYYIPSSWWGDDNVSYQHASYELVYPRSLAPRYKLYNSQVLPKKKVVENTETLTWTLENLTPINYESYGPGRVEIIPHIVAAPTEFEFEGYAGTMNSWDEFGQWINLLNRNRDILPEDTKLKVRSVVSNLKTREEKIKALYEYMQSKTRYVGIQLGIGGYQPFEAETVDKNGYGDCKALSNYMIALLKEADILANYVLISAGSPGRALEEKFPSTQFNHAIAAVPNGKDTLWLECTSQTNPFGYQGRFTGDRKALMITDKGGVVVNTLRYSPEQNLQSRTAEVNIDETGNAKARIKTIYNGLQYENDNLNWALSSTEKQKKWIEKNTEIPNFNINSFSMREVKDKIPSATVQLDVTLNRFASTSGKRLFVTPNLMNRITSVPERTTERRSDVITKSNFIDVDTIIYSIPENLYPEFLPQPTKINSKFGEYETNFKFEAGKVIYTRRLKMWKGRFPKETYNELVDFYKNVSKADNTKLVFLNKT